MKRREKIYFNINKNGGLIEAILFGRKKLHFNPRKKYRLKKTMRLFSSPAGVSGSSKEFAELWKNDKSKHIIK